MTFTYTNKFHLNRSEVGSIPVFSVNLSQLSLSSLLNHFGSLLRYCKTMATLTMAVSNLKHRTILEWHIFDDMALDSDNRSRRNVAEKGKS